ncbi:YrdB family protein [Microbacterium hydrocarbonoxydans]|nr:YrdB family protein [Microbacterium hydrocarbonoxydans]
MPQREPSETARMEAEWGRYSSPVRELVMLNAVAAFVLELAMLVFVAWWALLLDVPWWARVLIAIALVGGLVVLWGTFASPRARVALPTPGVVAVKAVAFGAGALALWGVGGPVAAAVFAVVAAVSVAVTTIVRMPAA